MSFKHHAAGACVLLLVGLSAAGRAGSGQADAPEFGMMEAAELKERLAGSAPPAVLDVRSTESYLGSDGKIKGAIHVRLRRLRQRLAAPPLKDVPRDREIVAYCACPNDEASVRAAETLLAAGFKRVYVLRGGWQAWLAVRGPVEPRPK